MKAATTQKGSQQQSSSINAETDATHQAYHSSEFVTHITYNRMADTTDPVTPAPEADAEDQKAQKKRSPSDFLKSVLGKPAIVKLNSGIEYRGVLACLDGYLNIAMEQTQEYGLDGQLKATYGDCFIRGNNVLHISSQKRK